MVVLDERTCVQQLDACNLLGGVDVGGIFFVCSVNVGSGRHSFVLAVEFYKLLELSSRGDEVLSLPEVIEWVQGVEGVEVCKYAHDVISDASDEAGDRAIIMCISVGDTEELFTSVRKVELPREGRKYEFVGVTPHVEGSGVRKARDPFSQGVGRRVLIWQEQGRG